MQRSLLSLAVFVVVASSGAFGTWLAWTAAQAHRAPLGALESGSEWVVDDPRQALVLRRAELATVWGRVPDQDTLAPGRLPTLFPTLLGNALRPLTAIYETEEELRPIREDLAVRLSSALFGLATAMAAGLAYCLASGAGIRWRLLAAGVGGPSFALAAMLGEARGGG